MNSPIAILSSWLREHYRQFAEVSTLDLIVRLTMIFLLVKPMNLWYLQVPVTLLCILGLASPRAGRSPVVWFLLAYFLLARVVIFWDVVDNHIYLLGYWALALACALALAESRTAISVSAHLLLGLAFLFSVLWKGVLSPDFVSGEFFRYTLLSDRRFHDFVLLFGALSPQEYASNQGELRQLARTGEPITLIESARLVLLAQISTWWTLVHEAFIAVAFLGKRVAWLSKVRHAALVSFAWITYPFATVVGFGWLLMILGIAQCEPELKRTRLLYLATLLVIFVHQFVPWTTALTETVTAGWSPTNPPS